MEDLFVMTHGAERAYIHFLGWDSAREWDVPEVFEDLPGDHIYYGEIFDFLLREFPSFRFVLTWHLDRLPIYGPDVIVLLIDEQNIVPIYQGQVGAVVRPFGLKPFIGFNSWFPLSRVKVGQIRPFTKKHLRNIWRGPRIRKAVTLNPTAPTFDIPLGPWIPDLGNPLKSIGERSVDLFFAGNHEDSPPTAFRGPLWEKELFRYELAENVKKILAKGEYVVDYRRTGQFLGNAFRTRAEYLFALAETKIALCPRGTSFESYRFYEAARAGCVVIADPQAESWFMRDCPAIIVERWSELPALVEGLMADPVKLESISKATLAWYAANVEPTSVGLHLAKEFRRAKVGTAVERPHPKKSLRSFPSL